MNNSRKRKCDDLEVSTTRTVAPRRNPGRTAKLLHSVIKPETSEDLKGLEGLPAEIFNDVVSYLPIASVIALGLVNKRMHSQVTRPRVITKRELMEDCLAPTSALANLPLALPKSKIPDQYPSITSILRSSWPQQKALFEFEDKRERDLGAPRLKYTEIIVWLEVMDLKLLPLVTCSICGLRQKPSCFKGPSPQRSYTRTCQSCLTRVLNTYVAPAIAENAWKEAQNPTRLKRLTCVVCQYRHFPGDFPGWGPSQHMQLQKQEKRICWECLRRPRDGTQIMVATLQKMGIDRLRGFLDGELDRCWVNGIRGPEADARLQRAKAEGVVLSRYRWEFRDGHWSLRWERLARNLLAFRARLELRTRAACKVHDEKMEEWRRGGLL